MDLEILVIEDNKYWLKYINKSLGNVLERTAVKYPKQETNTIVAKNYQAAEEEIARQDYPLVLLDHKMPRDENGENWGPIGYNLAEIIKKKSPETIIMGTSCADDYPDLSKLEPFFPNLDYQVSKGNNLFEFYLEKAIERVLAKD